jgi:hypothetical protein
VKVTVTIDSEAGAIKAAKAPWSARAPNSSSWLGASPPIAEAAANPMSPMMKVRLRPGVVGDPTAQQQQRAEGQCVGRDHPLSVGVADVEVCLGRRQRDVHDRGVEDDHQLGRRQDDQRPPSARVRHGLLWVGSGCANGFTHRDSWDRGAAHENCLEQQTTVRRQ